MEKLRIVLVDDHPVIREGLRLTIQAQPDMEVVGEASSGEEAVSLASELKPDVLVLDLKMPGIGGLAAIAGIKEAVGDTRVLIFTTYGEQEDIVGAIEAGADGYLLKGSSSAEIVGAIRSASRGESPLDPSAARALVSHFGPHSKEENAPLSDREIEVLQLVSQGFKNKEIAKQLFISEKTVKAHMGSILTKLNVDDRTAAVTTALKAGLISL